MAPRASSVAVIASALVACGSFAARDDAADRGADAGSPAAGEGGADATSIDPDADASPTRSAAYEALVKSHAPVAYWRFAEGVGGVTTSIVGQAHALSVPATGPAFDATGLFGPESRSMKFTSATTSALVEDSAKPVRFVGPNTFALEAWIQVGTTDNAARWLVHQTATAQSYGIFVDSTGFGAEVTFGSGTVERAHWEGSIGAGWHHVVLNRNSAPLYLWVDGQRRASPGGQAVGVQTFTPLFVVGGQTQANGLLPNGSRIAEVAVYDHELRDAQILGHHAAGL